MKATIDGIVVEGTPDELAKYMEIMNHKREGKTLANTVMDIPPWFKTDIGACQT